VLKAWSENTSYTKQNMLKSAMTARRGVKIGSLAMLLFAAQPANALEWELVTDDYSNARVEVPDQKPVQEGNSIDATSNEGVKNTLKSDREDPSDDQVTGLLEGSTDEGIGAERVIHIDSFKNTPSSISSKSANSERRIKTTVSSLSAENNGKTGNTEYNPNELGSQLPTATIRTRLWELVTDNTNNASEHETNSIVSAGVKWEYVPAGQEIKTEDLMADSKFNEVQKGQIESTTEAYANRHRKNWLSKLLRRNKSMAMGGTSYRESKITSSNFANIDMGHVDNNTHLKKNIVEESFMSKESADIVLGFEHRELWNASEQALKDEKSKTEVHHNMQLGVNELKTTRIGSSFQLLRIRF
jgi:hypothetical protein